MNFAFTAKDPKEAFEKLRNFVHMNGYMMPYSYPQFEYLFRTDFSRKIDLPRGELELAKKDDRITARLTKRRPAMRDIIDDMTHGRLPRF